MSNAYICSHWSRGHIFPAFAKRSLIILMNTLDVESTRGSNSTTVLIEYACATARRSCACRRSSLSDERLLITSPVLLVWCWLIYSRLFISVSGDVRMPKHSYTAQTLGNTRFHPYMMRVASGSATDTVLGPIRRSGDLYLRCNK